MEEKILEIIKNNPLAVTTTAKEITTHVFEFIEWIGFEKPNRLYYREISNTWFIPPVFDKEYTTEELYQYWKNNVKK